MGGRAAHCLALLVLCWLLVPAGCRDPEKERAIADAQAARTVLAQVKTQLVETRAELEVTQKERNGLKADVGDLTMSLDDAKTKLDAAQRERDALKANVGALSAAIEDVKARLAAATQAHDKLQTTSAEQVTVLKDQLTQLTRDRDAAMAKLADARGVVEKLNAQVLERTPQAAASGGGASAPAAAVAPGASGASQPAPPAGTAPAPAGKTIDLGNGVSMEFVLVPAGSFSMGSPDSEKDRDGDEGPARKVQIAKAFYIGKYEVTQGQYQAVMGTAPSNAAGQNLPIENVSWAEAAACCKKIGGRLPTEAEWEYACRAGSETRFHYGDDPDGAQLGEYGWYSANSGGAAHPVGQKKPNAFGLFDMHGNVYEWCSDWFGAYENAPTVDPVGASSSQHRLCRGGGWIVGARFCRCANRHIFSPDFRSVGLGFRVVLDAK